MRQTCYGAPLRRPLDWYDKEGSSPELRVNVWFALCETGSGKKRKKGLFAILHVLNSIWKTTKKGTRMLFLESLALRSPFQTRRINNCKLHFERFEILLFAGHQLRCVSDRSLIIKQKLRHASPCVAMSHSSAVTWLHSLNNWITWSRSSFKGLSFRQISDTMKRIESCRIITSPSDQR